jgi:hypothetical protein
MNRNAVAALAGALLLLGVACSGDDDTAELRSETASADDPAADETGGGDAASETEAADEPRPSAEASGDEPMGTARTSFPAENGPVPVRVDVTSLERNGDLVELGLVISNEAAESDAAPNDQHFFGVLFEFGGGESRTDLAGIGLVDQAEQKMYLPVLDDAGDCLCTNMNSLSRIYPGESYDLAATFGGVPDGVETLDLHIPGFPPIAGLTVDQ